MTLWGAPEVSKSNCTCVDRHGNVNEVLRRSIEDIFFLIGLTIEKGCACRKLYNKQVKMGFCKPILTISFACLQFSSILKRKDKGIDEGKCDSKPLNQFLCEKIRPLMMGYAHLSCLQKLMQQRHDGRKIELPLLKDMIINDHWSWSSWLLLWKRKWVWVSIFKFLFISWIKKWKRIGWRRFWINIGLLIVDAGLMFGESYTFGLDMLWNFISRNYRQLLK